MTKESVYKELRNYGEILDDREATTSFGFERMLRIRYEEKIYFVELLKLYDLCFYVFLLQLPFD